jgi:hypothetical protein
MNQLQHISEEEHGKVLVTLNAPYDPRPETIINRQNFSHPMFTLKVKSQVCPWIFSLTLLSPDTMGSREPPQDSKRARHIFRWSVDQVRYGASSGKA